MPLLTINAHDVDAAGVSIDAELPVSWLDQQLLDADVRGQVPGRVQARLSKSGGDVVVRGRVDAKVSTPCARCLDPAGVDITAELALLLRPDPTATARTGAARAAARAAAARGSERGKSTPQAKQAVGGARGGQAGGARRPDPDMRRGRPEPEYEFSGAEADVDTYDGETVILDEFVREAVLLELPNFPLCSEACPGIPEAASRGRSAGSTRSSTPPLDPRLAPLGALKAKLGQVQQRADEPQRETTSAEAPPRPSRPPKGSPPARSRVKLKTNRVTKITKTRSKPKKKKK